MQVAYGKWEVQPATSPDQVEGTCQKCGTKVAAIKLELKSLPFGRGEQWRCKGGC